MQVKTNRKKILFVITKSVWGGAQKYVYDLGARLPPDDFEVLVACGEGGPLAEKLGQAGIGVIPIARLRRDIGIFSEAASFFSLLGVLIREKPDIIHLSSSKAAGLGALAAKIASLVIGHWSLVIFTVHGWPFNEDRPPWQRGIIFALSWLSAMLCRHVILIDEADYKIARRMLPKSKPVLIRHGIEPPDFLRRSSARSFFAEKIGRPTGADTLFIGTVAELTPNKGLNYAIEAFALLKSEFLISNFQFLIFGEGELRDDLKRQIQTLGLADTIRLLGFVPEAGRYLKGLDLFILPSVKEGLPYALMEAMAAGLPIVATSVGGIPDLVEDGKSCFLVPPKDPKALAEAVAVLIGNSARANAMAEAARHRMEERYGLEKMLQSTLALYGAKQHQ